MPAPRADIHVPRYTLLAALIAATLVALAAACGSASAADIGPTASTGGSGFVVQPVTAPKGAFAGKPTTLNGHVAGATGTVSITAKQGKADWLPVGTAEADSDGDFSFTWTPPKPGRYNFRFTEPGSTDVTTAADDAPTQGTVSVYRRQKATWYGPESYGSRTACGIKLTARTLGVAHKTLPCGTRVEFFLRGKRITLPVIDRGPFANGATWDLTLTAMRRLGSSSTEVLGALPL
jgi:rare lipoprotein A (peptidoglycan hydrolase)